jgi:hypothetical protein
METDRMNNLASYIVRRLKAEKPRVGNFLRMDNTTYVHFVVNNIEYEMHLPKYENDAYYHDYFSRNYPELLL